MEQRLNRILILPMIVTRPSQDPPDITVSCADAPKNVEHAVGCCSKAMVVAWRRGRARGRKLRPCDGVGAEAVEIIEVC